MKNQNGFSLVELMVVVIIVGILAKIALPSYYSYVLKSHRTAAINALLDLGSREARYYTTNNTYTTSMATLGYGVTDPNPMPVTGGSSTTYYNLSVASATPATFTLSAQPQGNQANDTCGTYTYDYLGNKGISSGTVSDCWKQ